MSQIRDSLDKLQTAAKLLEQSITNEVSEVTSVEALYFTLSEVQQQVEMIRQNLDANEASPIRYIDKCG